MRLDLPDVLPAAAGERGGGALLESLPLVTYTLQLRPPFTSLYVSPQLEPLFGYDAADCLGSDGFWSSKVHAEDLASFRAALERTAETHESLSVVYRVRAGDGRQVWVRDVGVVAHDGDEHVLHGYLADVTRECELEQELERERALADAFFRDSAVGLAVTDAEGRYVRVNESLALLNGIPADAHIGRTIGEIAPSIARLVDDLHAHVRVTGEALRERELVVESSAGRRNVLLSSFPLRGGKDARFGRVVVDITERRQAEVRYRDLIERLPLVTYVNEIAPSFKTVFVSPQIEELLGYPRSLWLEDPELWDRIVHPDDLAEVERLETEARERHEPFELEYRVVGADGGERWVLDLMQTVYDEDGNALFEQGFLVDVTERRTSESLFRAVFDNAFEAIWIADDEGRSVDLNRAACELVGRPRDELVGRTIADISLAAWRQFLDAGEAKGRYVVVRPDGEERELEFAAKANVLPGLHLSVARDETERRCLEQELGRAQKLESVGRLAGGVAHDFNNMLTAIGGYAQLLRARALPGSLEHHHAGEIERAADRAAALTAQLLAFGRRQVLQVSAVDLNELIQQVVPRFATSGAVIVCELDESLEPATADPEQVETILANLVANAAEVSDPERPIAIRSRSTEVSGAHSELAPGRFAVVSIRDSGPGIEEPALEHIFEPFFTTKAQGEGVGLGLATAYGIARQSGGTIRVESDRSGSTFSVYLPVRPSNG